MTFEKEDKAAWLNSEVMREFEKIAAAGGLEVSEEAFEPIDEEWEEEDDTGKLIDAVEEFQGSGEESGEELSEESGEEPEDVMTEDPIDELLIAHQRSLIGAIEKLSWQLADKSKTKAAYKVERTLQNIKALMEE